jgi:hypothetical protein
MTSPMSLFAGTFLAITARAIVQCDRLLCIDADRRQGICVMMRRRRKKFPAGAARHKPSLRQIYGIGRPRAWRVYVARHQNDEVAGWPRILILGIQMSYSILAGKIPAGQRRCKRVGSAIGVASSSRVVSAATAAPQARF